MKMLLLLAALAAPPIAGITAARLSVTASAAVVPGGGCSVTVFNPSSTPVYLGGSTVAHTTGFPVCSDATLCVPWVTLDVRQGQVYAVTQTPATATLYYIVGSCT
jgi:hypothetical protein